MDLFLKLNLDKVAWSLRRLYCPVSKSALVLEVGSGGNPYFRSNVLIDAYLETRERHFAKLISDRPTVLGFVENLPFKNDSFDFVIASHVLEHSKDPVLFLSEIQRVASAGYIEVPDAFFERLACYLDHRLEITDKKNELIIRKKESYIQDNEILDLFSNKVKPIFGNIVSKKPFQFNVRFYWSKDSGGIKYKILNPEYEFNWESPKTEKKEIKSSTVARLKKRSLHYARKYLSQHKRNNKIDLMSLIMCPKCTSDKFVKNKDIDVSCLSCGSTYEMDDKVIKFN